MGYERQAAGAPNRYFLTPQTSLQQQMLNEAKAYKGITTPGMPPGWAFNGEGNLVDISNPEDASNPRQAPSIPLGPPNRDTGPGFLGQLVHALPYIGGAELMGIAGAYGPLAASGSGGSAGTAGAVGTSGASGAAGVLPATATVPTSTGTIAGLSGGSGFGTAAAAGGGAAAGTTGAAAVLPSTTTVPTSTSTVAGLPSFASAGGAPTAAGSSSWLGGVGKFLGSAAGGSAISAGANLLGAYMQGNANKDAAKIQTDFLREALDYEKHRDTYAQGLEASRYGDLTSRLTPYISSGQSANARMAQILGLPVPETSPMGTAPTPMGSQNSAPTYATRTGLNTNQPSEGTAIPRPGGTLMRAPNGSLKQVPPNEVEHWQQRGAQLVNG